MNSPSVVHSSVDSSSSSSSSLENDDQVMSVDYDADSLDKWSKESAHTDSFLTENNVDKQIQRRIWSGRIPIQFKIHGDDITSNEKPLSLMIMAPRVMYFPMFFSDLKDHFGNFVPSLTEDMWVEYNGMALNWHVPIGVSFDLLTTNATTSNVIPWEVYIHFQSYPEGKLLADPSLESLRWHYMSRVKEADFIKHGNTRKIMGLPKKDHENLWEGICKADFDMFTSVNDTLILDTGDFKHIPVRVYIAGTSRWRQLPVEPFKQDGTQAQTLYECLNLFLPKVFPMGSSSTTSEEEETEETEFVIRKSIPSHSVVVQGIEPELDTPLDWLYSYASFPDNFLHVVVVENGKDE